MIKKILIIIFILLVPGCENRIRIYRGLGVPNYPKKVRFIRMNEKIQFKLAIGLDESLREKMGVSSTKLFIEEVLSDISEELNVDFVVTKIVATDLRPRLKNTKFVFPYTALCSFAVKEYNKDPRQLNICIMKERTIDGVLGMFVPAFKSVVVYRQSDNEKFFNTLKHEIGHFLGVYGHTYSGVMFPHEIHRIIPRQKFSLDAIDMIKKHQNKIIDNYDERTIDSKNDEANVG